MQGQEVSDDEVRESMVLDALRRVGGIAMSASARECLRALELESSMTPEQFVTTMAALRCKRMVDAPFDYGSTSREPRYMHVELSKVRTRAM